MNRLYYDKYVSSNPDKKVVVNSHVFKHNIPYFKWIVKKSKIVKTDNILDLGCGNGALIWFLTKNGYGEIRGVDISEEQVNIAKSLNLSGIEVCDIISYLKRTDDKFEIIFLINVLEHFKRSKSIELLSLIRSKLNPSGKLIIHVPNASGIFGMKIFYGDMTHKSCFTESSIVQLLKITGFSETKVFEDKPIIHGTISLVRRIIYETLGFAFRLFYMAETGATKIILSSNMLVITHGNSD